MCFLISIFKSQTRAISWLAVFFSYIVMPLYRRVSVSVCGRPGDELSDSCWKALLLLITFNESPPSPVNTVRNSSHFSQWFFSSTSLFLSVIGRCHFECLCIYIYMGYIWVKQNSNGKWEHMYGGVAVRDTEKWLQKPVTKILRKRWYWKEEGSRSVVWDLVAEASRVIAGRHGQNKTEKESIMCWHHWQGCGTTFFSSFMKPISLQKPIRVLMVGQSYPMVL